MIDFLDGRLARKIATRIVIECGGVGNEVLVPLTTSAALPPPDTSRRLLTVLLVSLGYKPAVASRIVGNVVRANPAMRNDLDALIRAAITP